MEIKTFIKYAAILTAVITLFLACEKNDAVEPTLLVTPNTIIADATGGSYTITVTSNSIWTAESNAEWAVVTVLDSGFVVEVKDNVAAKEREAVVTVSISETLQRFIIIKQPGDATELSISPSTLTYTVEGESKEFEVTTSSADWTVTSSATWAIVVPDKAINKVTVNVAPNGGTKKRAATVTITARSKTETVAIKQQGTGIIGEIPEGIYVVSKNSYRVTIANGTTNSTEYQGTHNEGGQPNEVTITKIDDDDDNYHISDLFGGFFYPGSGSPYNDTYTSLGTLYYDGENFTLVGGVSVPSGPGPWDTNLLLEESGYDTETHTITLVIPWSTFFVFHLTLIEKAYYNE